MTAEPTPLFEPPPERYDGKDRYAIECTVCDGSGWLVAYERVKDPRTHAEGTRMHRTRCDDCGGTGVARWVRT